MKHLGTYQNDYLSLNSTIKGSGYYFQLYPINQSLSQVDGISDISFNNCIEVIKSFYAPQDISTFLFVKFDIKREECSNNNQIEYQI